MDLCPLEDAWGLGCETLEGLDPYVDCRAGMGRYPDAENQGKQGIAMGIKPTDSTDAD